MPGAPLEPGKALKEGGGPYGLPGAVGIQTSVRVVVYRLGDTTYLHMGCTPSWAAPVSLLAASRRILDLECEQLLIDTVA